MKKISFFHFKISQKKYEIYYSPCLALWVGLFQILQDFTVTGHHSESGILPGLIILFQSRTFVCVVEIERNICLTLILFCFHFFFSFRFQSWSNSPEMIMDRRVYHINETNNDSIIRHINALNLSDIDNEDNTDYGDYLDLTLRELAQLYCYAPLIYLNHIISFATFTFFGLIGNIALLLAILLSPGLRNAPNILLINLTIADLVYMLIHTPFSIIHEMTPCWLYGTLACKFRHYVPLVAQAVGIFSLAALSRERYNAIVRGLESRISRSTRRTLLVVVTTWIFAIIIAAPVFLITQTQSGGLLCQYMPMGLTRTQVYIVIQVLLLYIIPLFYISVNYVRLAQSLCRSTRANLAQNISAANPIQARKRLAQIVLVITVVFGIFWLPYYIYFLWFVFVEDDDVTYNASKVRFFRHFYYYMSLANSCLNPWIIFVMSSAHRRSFLQCICCSLRPSKKGVVAVHHRGSRVSSSSVTAPTNLSRIWAIMRFWMDHTRHALSLSWQWRVKCKYILYSVNIFQPIVKTRNFCPPRTQLYASLFCSCVIAKTPKLSHFVLGKLFEFKNMPLQK